MPACRVLVLWALVVGVLLTFMSYTQDFKVVRKAPMFYMNRGTVQQPAVNARAVPELSGDSLCSALPGRAQLSWHRRVAFVGSSSFSCFLRQLLLGLPAQDMVATPNSSTHLQPALNGCQIPRGCSHSSLLIKCLFFRLIAAGRH